MHYGLICMLIFQFKPVQSLIFKLTDSHSIAEENVIHVEDGIPSKIACVHKCMYLQANALYFGLKCQCIKKELSMDSDGDAFVSGTYLEEKEVKKGAPKIGYCVIRVLSIDSRNTAKTNGFYFNFNRISIGLEFKEEKSFLVKNSRSGRIGEVIVWGYNFGGSVGDSHGRYSSGMANGNWQIGDIIIISEEVPNCQEKLWFWDKISF